MNQRRHCTVDICANTICQVKTKNKNKMKSQQGEKKKSFQGGEEALGCPGARTSLVFPGPCCLVYVFQLFPAFMGRHLTIFQFTQ